MLDFSIGNRAHCIIPFLAPVHICALRGYRTNPSLDSLLQSHDIVTLRFSFDRIRAVAGAQVPPTSLRRDIFKPRQRPQMGFCEFCTLAVFLFVIIVLFAGVNLLLVWIRLSRTSSAPNTTAQPTTLSISPNTTSTKTPPPLHKKKPASTAPSRGGRSDRVALWVATALVSSSAGALAEHQALVGRKGEEREKNTKPCLERLSEEEDPPVSGGSSSSDRRSRQNYYSSRSSCRERLLLSRLRQSNRTEQSKSSERSSPPTSYSFYTPSSRRNAPRGGDTPSSYSGTRKLSSGEMRKAFDGGEGVDGGEEEPGALSPVVVDRCSRSPRKQHRDHRKRWWIVAGERRSKHSKAPQEPELSKATDVGADRSTNKNGTRIDVGACSAATRHSGKKTVPRNAGKKQKGTWWRVLKKPKSQGMN